MEGNTTSSTTPTVFRTMRKESVILVRSSVPMKPFRAVRSQAFGQPTSTFDWQRDRFAREKMHYGRRHALLSPVAIPDRTRRPEIQTFAPNGLRLSQTIDPDGKIIAKWKAETLGADVGIARHVARDSRLRRPSRAAVGGTAVKYIPQRIVARVHPGN